MKMTFPHMGNMYIPIKTLLDTLGITYIIPPRCNKATLSQGLHHSPETICLPFKIILGDFLQGINQGADTILFGGGCGQCRLGYFGDLYAEILRDINLDVTFINLELQNMSPFDVLKKLKPYTGTKSNTLILRAILLAVITVFSVESLYNLSFYTRCRELHKGTTDRIINDFEQKVKSANGYGTIRKLIRTTQRILKKISLKQGIKPLKIAIIGEIYICSEPYSNFHIEKILGNLGVHVYNSLGMGMWIREHLLGKFLFSKNSHKVKQSAYEFIKTDDVGGHGVQTVGNAIEFAKKGFDGVLHLYPLSCMPEIIAQCAFDQIRSQYDIPIMTLVIDEMTSEVGYTTRIEAFLDMINRRKLSFSDVYPQGSMKGNAPHS